MKRRWYASCWHGSHRCGLAKNRTPSCTCMRRATRTRWMLRNSLAASTTPCWVEFWPGKKSSMRRRRLPVWLRDSLINMLYLFPINSFWAAARPPVGPWCRPEDGLFGLMDGIVEDPAIEPIPDTFYANAPLVFSSLTWRSRPCAATRHTSLRAGRRYGSGAGWWVRRWGLRNDGGNGIRHAHARLSDHDQRPVLRGHGGPLLASHRQRRSCANSIHRSKRIRFIR